jgi:hypothetical protein
MTGKKKSPFVAFVLGLVGLWPILYFAVFVVLLVFAGERTAEFSLEPRSTQFNQLIFAIALGVTALIQIVAVLFGIFARAKIPKGERGRGFATAAIIISVIGFLFITTIFTLFLVISAQFARDDGELSDEERVLRCKENRKHIETALGPGMWGFDHPDMTADMVAGLDLSPEGELINNDTGIIYIDPEYLDCPADDDPTDADYSAVVNPDGTISVLCIDDVGTAAEHND